MPLEGITLTWYELIAILVLVPTTLIIPLTVWLTKIKGAVDQNHKCIERVEKQMEYNKNAGKQGLENTERLFLALQNDIRAINVSMGIMTDKALAGERLHAEIKQEEKDIRVFFTDWIQRVEDLLRDQRLGMNVETPRDSDIDRRLELIEKILMKLVSKEEEEKMS